MTAIPAGPARRRRPGPRRSGFDRPRTWGRPAIGSDRVDLPFARYTGKGSEEIASDAISAGVTSSLQKGTGTGQYVVLANRITNAVELS